MAKVDLNRVTAVMVTYHSKMLLSNIKKTLALFQNIVVVDNSVDLDKSVCVELKRKFPSATIIANKINSGFGGGNNIGIGEVNTEFALIINPDLEIETKSIAAMLNTADTYLNAVVVGARVYDSRVKLKHPSFSYGWRYPDEGKKNEIEPSGDLSAFWLSGCCLLIRVKEFIDMGGFDENFFMYYEEFDICQRIIDQGKDCVLSAKALVSHNSQSSSVPSLQVEYIKTLHWNRSKQVFLQKYGYRKKSNIGCVTRFVIFTFVGLIFLLLLSPKRSVKAFAKAHAHISIL